MRPHSQAARAAFMRLARDAGHNFGAERVEVVELEYGRLRLGLDVVEVDERPDRAAALLSMLVESPLLTPAWRDEFAAFGPTLDEAIEQAVAAWVAGPLELLREALAEKPGEHRFALTQPSLGVDRTWLVFEGPLQLTGPDAAQHALVAQLEEEPLFALLAQAESVPELAPDRAHVLKLYVAKLDDEPPLVDALLDGVLVPAMGEALARLPWPASAGHRTLRQYLCLVPKPA